LDQFFVARVGLGQISRNFGLGLENFP